jgi:hypothetical protein
MMKIKKLLHISPLFRPHPFHRPHPLHGHHPPFYHPFYRHPQHLLDLLEEFQEIVHLYILQQLALIVKNIRRINNELEMQLLNNIYILITIIPVK